MPGLIVLSISTRSSVRDKTGPGRVDYWDSIISLARQLSFPKFHNLQWGEKWGMKWLRIGLSRSVEPHEDSIFWKGWSMHNHIPLASIKRPRHSFPWRRAPFPFCLGFIAVQLILMESELRTCKTIISIFYISVTPRLRTPFLKNHSISRIFWVLYVVVVIFFSPQ